MLEELNVNFELENVDNSILLNKRRKLNCKYMCAEVLWYFMNTSDAKYMKKFAPSYDQYLEKGEIAYWAYGPRFVDQLGEIVLLLDKRPESRRAVISLWNYDDLRHSLEEDVKDVPCVCQFQFFIRDKRLVLRVNQRSQDMWVGFPNDIFSFTCIQRAVAGTLGLECGSFYHNMGSCHLYTSHVVRALEAIDCAVDSNWISDVDKPWPISTDIVDLRAAAIREEFGLNRLINDNSMVSDLVRVVNNVAPDNKILRLLGDCSDNS